MYIYYYCIEQCYVQTLALSGYGSRPSSESQRHMTNLIVLFNSVGSTNPEYQGEYKNTHQEKAWNLKE